MRLIAPQLNIAREGTSLTRLATDGTVEEGLQRLKQPVMGVSLQAISETVCPAQVGDPWRAVCVWGSAIPQRFTSLSVAVYEKIITCLCSFLALSP